MTVTGTGSILSASDSVIVGAFRPAVGASALLRLEAGSRVNSFGLEVLGEGTLEIAPGAQLFTPLVVSGGGKIRALGDIEIGNNVQITDELGPNGSGAILDTNGFNATFVSAISGAGGVQKIGSGTVTLTADNTYNGGTMVFGGTLLANNVSGSATGLDAVHVFNGVLGGTGRVGSSVTAGALVPGDANPGTLEIGGTVTFPGDEAMPVLALRLGGSIPGDGAGFYSQLHMSDPNGTITIEAPGMTSLNVSLHGGFHPGAADVFYLVTREDAGAFDVPFAGLPEGASVLLGSGFAGTITYEANWTGAQETSTLTGGNDVAIYDIVANGAAMPQALRITALPDGSKQLDWDYLADNASNITFFVEQSLDLEGWPLIGKFAGTTPGSYSFIAPDPGTPQAFYRVIASLAGCALRFDGAPRFVQVPHHAAFNAQTLTVSAWIRTTNADANARGIVSKYADGSLQGWSVPLIRGHVRGWYFGSTGWVWDGGHGLDGGFVADGEWHHVAMVIGPDNGAMYVDGILRSGLAWTGAPSATVTTQPLQIGRYHTYPIGFDGDIDEVSVWSVALTPAEVVALYHRGPTGTESGLEALWTFDNGPAPIATDRTPNARDGLLINSPEWVPSTAPLFR